MHMKRNWPVWAAFPVIDARPPALPRGFRLVVRVRMLHLTDPGSGGSNPGTKRSEVDLGRVVQRREAAPPQPTERRTEASGAAVGLHIGGNAIRKQYEALRGRDSGHQLRVRGENVGNFSWTAQVEHVVALVLQ